jgi:hypothetical protein
MCVSRSQRRYSQCGETNRRPTRKEDQPAGSAQPCRQGPPEVIHVAAGGPAASGAEPERGAIVGRRLGGEAPRSPIHRLLQSTAPFAASSAMKPCPTPGRATKRTLGGGAGYEIRDLDRPLASRRSAVVRQAEPRSPAPYSSDGEPAKMGIVYPVPAMPHQSSSATRNYRWCMIQ